MIRSFALVCILSLVAFGCGDGRGDAPGADTDGAVGPVGEGGAPLTCANGVRDGDETHRDCGGSCDPCPDGSGCERPSDCQSTVCVAGYCLVESCGDFTKNGTETDVDCGGGCGPCAGSMACGGPADCISLLCMDSVCAETSCASGAKDGAETDVDCGGPACPSCGTGLACSGDEDCMSGLCDANTCAAPSCEDRVHNGDETDEDCGGSCEPCRDASNCNENGDCMSNDCRDNRCISCQDGLYNGEETDRDCGGPTCEPCRDGRMCGGADDCINGDCRDGHCRSCMDRIRNGEETDIDCGGIECDGCMDGRMCGGNDDCASGDCRDDVCISCMDGMRNGDETDVDCGGPDCGPCADGRMCGIPAHCESGICTDNRCQAPSCDDSIVNGGESDVDCGGTSSCDRCPQGGACTEGTDCDSRVCRMNHTCAAPTCSDGYKNGNETDVDCGGPTCRPTPGGKCQDNRLCEVAADCTTNRCTTAAGVSYCGNSPCVPFGRDEGGYVGCSYSPATLPCTITAAATGLTLTDDSAVEVDIGFSVDVYGTDYDKVWVGSNGTLAFSGRDTSYVNACFPRSTVRFLAALWDDLNPGASGATVRHQTRGAGANRRFVVEWDVERLGASGNRYVFRASIAPNGNIDVCYLDTVVGNMTYDGGGSATVGLNSGAGDFVQFSCNTASLSDGLLIRYLHP